MRKGSVAASLAAAVALWVVPSLAGAIECTCRSADGRFALGETVCLKTAAGPRLARCEMAQNITSWKLLDRPCPIASTAGSGMVAMTAR